MRLPIASPGRLRDRAVESADTVLSMRHLPPRLSTLLAAAEGLIARLTTLIVDLEQLEVVAAGVLARADRTVTAANDTLVELAPDDPVQFRRLVDEVLPVLKNLNTVAPDMTELVAVSRALNEMLGSVPGMGKVKRRADEDQAEREAEQA